jgi:hypothetical protein
VVIPPLALSRTSANPRSQLPRSECLGGQQLTRSRARPGRCGDAGSRFWIDIWGYPDLGVYFADCPSAGHDMIAMDYSESGPSGDPRIVHVDQDWGFAVTVLAESFAEFARGLRHAATFDSE